MTSMHQAAEGTLFSSLPVLSPPHGGQSSEGYLRPRDDKREDDYSRNFPRGRHAGTCIPALLFYSAASSPSSTRGDGAGEFEMLE